MPAMHHAIILSYRVVEVMQRGQEDKRARSQDDRIIRQVRFGILIVLAVVAFVAAVASALGRLPVRAQEIPTATPTLAVRLVTEIAAPQADAVIASTVSIVGTALSEGFRRYDLHIATASSEDWRWLMTGTDFVNGGELYRFDTTRLPDGFYDLRLRTVRDDGNYVEDIVRDIEIRNANPPTPTPLLNAEGTPLPSATPTLVPPTATPTPEFISFVPNGQGIFAPVNGGVIRGQTPIIGTANGFPRNPFERFELLISPSGYEDWQQLIMSEEQHWQNTLYVLDTTRYSDGLYDLRLRIVYRDANYDEYEVRNVFIANYTAVREPTPTPTPIGIGIIRPRPNDNVSGIIEVVGAANTATLAQWELAWRPSGTELWSPLLSSTEAVPAYGLLATLDLAQLPIGAYDFRLRVINQDGSIADFIVPQVRVARPPAPVTPTPTPFG